MVEDRPGIVRPTMAGGAKNTDLRLAEARRAYLYGQGEDGKPIRSRKILMGISGVTRQTIDRHIKKWNAELDEFMKSSASEQLGICLREADLEAHAADIDWLRRTADNLKTEADNIEDRAERLDELVDSLIDQMDFGPEDAAKLTGLLRQYLEHSEQRKKLISLFLQTQKRWQDSSAITSTISAFETFQKEMMRRRAKQEPGPNGDPATPSTGADLAKQDGSVFRRGV